MQCFLFALPLLHIKVFPYAYSTPKWLFTYVIAAAAAMGLAFKRKLILPNKLLNIGLLALLGVQIFNYIYHDTYILSISTLDRLSFCILVLYFSSSFFDKTFSIESISTPIFWATAATLLWGALLFADAIVFKSTFGNENMMAQFLAISLLLQLCYDRSALRKLPRYALRLLIPLTMTALYFTACRSVLLGTGIAMAVVLWQKSVRIKSFAIYMVSTLLIITSVLYYKSYKKDCAFLEADTFVQISKTKDASRKVRIEMWKGTLNMVLDHPLGIGTGNFEFGFIPYKMHTKYPVEENLIDQSPHNEYLRILVEDGFLFFLLLLSIAGYIAFQFIIKCVPTKTAILPLCMLLGCEGFFQFPLTNAFPFLFVAIITGYMIAHIMPLQLLNHLSYRIFGTFIAGILLLLGYYRFTAEYVVQNHNDDYSQLEKACRYAPDHWQACAVKNLMELKQNKVREAMETARSELKKKPFNFVALRIYGRIVMQLRHIPVGCLLLSLYDKIFDYKSSYNNFTKKMCALEAIRPSLDANFKDTYTEALQLANSIPLPQQ